MFRVQADFDASLLLYDSGVLAGHQDVDCRATAVNDRRILLVQDNPQSPDSAVS
jgi:hypothetical protein